MESLMEAMATAMLGFPISCKRIQQLLYIGSMADAIRCDVAYLILNDEIQQNWNTQLSSWVIAALRKSSGRWPFRCQGAMQYPDIIFLAEVYTPLQPVNGNDTIPVTDLLSGDVYYRSASQMRSSGLNVVISSWYAQIFEY